MECFEAHVTFDTMHVDINFVPDPSMSITEMDGPLGTLALSCNCTQTNGGWAVSLMRPLY